MRRGLTLRSRAACWLGAGVVALLAAAPGFGQVPMPKVPETPQRSGLITRFDQPPPLLPHDCRRDTFFATRYGDKPFTHHPNSFKLGGLYGLYWRSQCTESVYPYFYGAPGQSTLGPECRPWWHPLRYVQAMTHPFKPVGMYYDQGTYVPVYDLDPLVPGPGAYPTPWYLNCPRGG